MKCYTWTVFIILPIKTFRVKNTWVLRHTCESSLHWGVLPGFQLLLQEGVSICRLWFVSAGSYNCPGHPRLCLKWTYLFRQVNFSMRNISMGSTLCLCYFLFLISTSKQLQSRQLQYSDFPCCAYTILYSLCIQNQMWVPFFLRIQ